MENESIHKLYMREALAIAREALGRGELPIGAILVSGDEVLVKAAAKDKEMKQRIAHAEILALLELDKRKPFPGNRRDVRLYTNLEPCMMCLGACLVTDVSEVYFGLDSPTDGAASMYREMTIQPADHVGCRAIKVIGGILSEESRDLFRKFCEKFPSGGYANWAKTLI